MSNRTDGRGDVIVHAQPWPEDRRPTSCHDCDDKSCHGCPANRAADEGLAEIGEYALQEVYRQRRLREDKHDESPSVEQTLLDRAAELIASASPLAWVHNGTTSLALEALQSARAWEIEAEKWCKDFSALSK